MPQQRDMRIPTRRDGGTPPQTPGGAAREAATAATATTHLPGRFEDFSPSSSRITDDPATLFVLSKKQPPGRPEGGRATSPTDSRRLLAAGHTGGAGASAFNRGPLAKKDMIRKRQQGRGGLRRGIGPFPHSLSNHVACSQKGPWQRVSKEGGDKDSEDEYPHKLDVYGMDGQGFGGSASAADTFLLSGSKVFIRSKEVAKGKTPDFRGLVTMQVSEDEYPHKLDVYGMDGQGFGGSASTADTFLLSGSKVFIRSKEVAKGKTPDFRLLGKPLLQQVQPFQLGGRRGGARGARIVQNELPILMHLSRQGVIPAEAQLGDQAKDPEEAIDSLMYLPSCDDAAIIDCLQQRFNRGNYFTSCDNMLIFVNPWDWHDSASDEVFNRSKAVHYWTSHVAELPSHPYLVARRAFTNARKQHTNQLVLTFGAFGSGQDRVHHELVKLFIRFALVVEDTWTDEQALATEAKRDAAVSLLESLHITNKGQLFGGRLMDLFQVELDSQGDVVGFSFLPNSSDIISWQMRESASSLPLPNIFYHLIDIISWQMRESASSLPLPNIFYHLMYGIHYNSRDPLLKNAGLHPVDVKTLMHYFPPPFILYEDVHYEKCQQILADLSTIGLSEKEKAEFLSLLSAVLVADVVSFKIQNELPKEEHEEEKEEEPSMPAAPRVRRITKQSGHTVERTLMVGKKTAMSLAGLDIINLLASLLGVDETVLRDIYLGTDAWQVRYLALKLFVRLRWWLLGIISQSLQLPKKTEIHNRVTLLKAAGLDFRRVSPDWAFNQLLHNYMEECLLHTFATWAFTLDQATYLLEDVKPPPANFTLNDEILEVFTGPEGVWQILKHEHTTRGGEAADDLSDGVPLAAVSFVDRILKSKGGTDKIRRVPGYEPPPPDMLRPKMAVRVVKATANAGKGAVVGGGSTAKKPQRSTLDPTLCRFTVVHTSGTLVYDATKFCTSDANAYTVAPNADGEVATSSKLSSYVKRWRQNSQTGQNERERYLQDAYIGMAGALCHEPQLPPRLRALIASEAKLERNRNGYLLGFNSVHVWKQLHDLQVLAYCTTRYLGMTVRLLYKEFLELYAILCIPTSYEQQTTKMLLMHPDPKAASAFLLQALRFPDTGYQLGRTMVFFRKAAFIILEKTRIDYLQRLVPAVTRVQRIWRTVRERAFLADMHWLCVRLQSHIRRVIVIRERKKLQPLKDLFLGAVITAGIAYAFRRLGLSDEVVHSIEIKAQALILEKITEEIIPNRAATTIQRHVRGWRERRKFQELKGLTMAFLSIQRKGAKLYSMRVMLNYRPIIRRTTVMREMISVQLNTSVVRIQSFFRMVIIRQQYVRLRNAAMLCQAGALMRLRRGDFLLARRMVVKIQRWWRSMLLLRGLDVDLALPLPIQMPKKADSVVKRRERVAFELLRPHLLRVQGVFRVERMRQEASYAYPISLNANGDCRGIYPRTWAQPLQDLLVQLAIAASQQQNGYMAEGSHMAPVMFHDLAIGGHHSLVLLAVRQPAAENFATRVRAVVKGGSWQDFNLVRSVYAWGWGDRGQLGEPQTPGEQGMTCVGPLKFVDRVFKDTVDLKTGHLVQHLVQEVDYTHTICAVAAGLDHSVALTSEGMAFAWGDNSEGQCGLGHRLMWARSPTLIPTIRNNGIRLKSIAAGPRQTGAVCSDGKALMWGAAHFVRLPTLIPDSHSYTPREVPLDPAEEALQICCSSGFNVMRTAGCSGVFAWGCNDSGQLGQGVEDKKSRDVPTFVPIPTTPAHRHVVSKVAVGTRFVVVALQQASSFLYTWGALCVVEASQKTSGLPEGADGKKASAAAEQRAAANPFLKFAGFKVQQPQPSKQASPPVKADKVKAVCRPTRVSHTLWKDDAVIDIGVTGADVLVLFESRVVHGYSALEILYSKKAATPVPVAEERVTIPSFFFKKPPEQPKAQEPPKEKAISCELERLKGEFTLEPGIYSLRHLKPLRMAIRSIHTTGNSVSLSFSWAKAVRPTRHMLDDIVSTRESKLLKKYKTATGDPIELPKSVIERDQNKYREIVESNSRVLRSEILSRENQSRLSAKQAAETLVPDSSLMQRMRATYSLHTAYNKSLPNDSED
ncbi:IQ calmodulin-binding motif domain-containing protein, putative [Eimeria praecox]|uniref:IQ calmodulin-binding motif domain-containing protein, putative n=1 Tax=Eimeria praecox TaxID=51316 RepID=U6G213_9EIME|nr:IQ calmodulin-binding motif domain-containing protein, putative [Eimeria praecox]